MTPGDCPRPVPTCASSGLTAGTGCCFDPKIYVALHRLLGDADRYSYSIKPALLCKPGFQRAESGK